MEYVLTGAEMKQCDYHTMEHFKVPSCVLMERAALSAVEVLHRESFDLTRVLVVCAGGNNGGDGLAVARLLHLEGVLVDVHFVGKETSCTKETARQLEICRKYGISLISNPVYSEYNSIVDAIFGIGLSRPVEGVYREVIEAVNQSGAKVLSLDIPSGIDADRGEVMGIAIRAHATVTFGFLKRGLLLYRGKAYAGKVLVRQIGITKESFLERLPRAFTYSGYDKVAGLLPYRDPCSNKGTFGKALMVAGSFRMAGAALLCAKAAYKTGVGLVRVFTDSCNREILQSQLAEAITDSYENENLEEHLLKITGWASAIGIGPGIGTGMQKQNILRTLLKKEQVPVVLDADALNIIAGNPSVLEGHKQPIVVTPHIGEMARLTGQSKEEILKDVCGTAVNYAKKWNVICVLKDAGTVVTDGEKIYINRSGNNGMSTGGSGDVLTGMITGFLAQGMKAMEASCLGVWPVMRRQRKKGAAACWRVISSGQWTW